MERGSVSIVLLTGTLLLCTSALAAADLGSMLVSRARAQTAADAAALAAVVHQVEVLAQQGDPVEQARSAAEHNGARLLSCECARETLHATVEVGVRTRAVLISAWDGRLVRARASAALDEAVLSYRRP